MWLKTNVARACLVYAHGNSTGSAEALPPLPLPCANGANNSSPSLSPRRIRTVVARDKPLISQQTNQVKKYLFNSILCCLGRAEL